MVDVIFNLLRSLGTAIKSRKVFVGAGERRGCREVLELISDAFATQVSLLSFSNWCSKRVTVQTMYRELSGQHIDSDKHL